MIASFSDEQLAHLQQIAGNLPVEKRAAFIEKPAEIKGLRFHNAQCNVWLYRNLKLRPYPPGRPCPDRLTSRRSTRCSTASTCRDDTRRASAEQRRSWRRRPAHEDKPRNRTENVSCVSSRQTAISQSRRQFSRLVSLPMVFPGRAWGKLVTSNCRILLERVKGIEPSS
jgi:hypothetical protein